MMRNWHNCLAIFIVAIVFGACSSQKQMEWHKGFLQNPELSELSGLASSDIYPNVLYGINDSGSNGSIFRLSPNGKDLGEITLKGALNLDTEALAYGNCKFAPKCLFIADIGDNLDIRPNVSIHIVAEPTLEQKSVRVLQTINFTYPDGAHDAESLFVNNEGKIFVIQKNYGKKFEDQKAKIFLIDIKDSNAKKIKTKAIEVGEIPFLTVENKKITGLTDAVIAKDNSLYIRDYFNVYKSKNFSTNNYALEFETIDTMPLRSAEAMTLFNNDKTLALSGEGVASPIKTVDIQ